MIAFADYLKNFQRHFILGISEYFDATLCRHTPASMFNASPARLIGGGRRRFLMMRHKADTAYS